MNTNELNKLIKKIKPINIDWDAPATVHADRREYQREYQKTYQHRLNAERTRQRQLTKMYALIAKYPAEASECLISIDVA